MYWIAGAIFAALLARFLWRSYCHPANVLCRQAANMNWVANGHTKDSNGFRDIRLKRGDLLAVISFKGRNVRLESPIRVEPFQDFIEVERWLARLESADASEITPEILYYQDVQKFVDAKGFHEPLLTLQGIDEEYCIASLEMHRAGFHSGTSPVVIAALTLDSVKHYDSSRQFAILFLKNLTRQLTETKK